MDDDRTRTATAETGSESTAVGGQTRRGVLAAVGTGLAGALAGCTAGGRTPAAPPESAEAAEVVDAYALTVHHGQTELPVIVPRTAYREARTTDTPLMDRLTVAREGEYLADVTRRLVEDTASRADAVHAVQSLVAGIEYGTDRATTGRTEYVRRLAETLVDCVGDCEDCAVLLAGLLAAPPLDCRVGLALPQDHCAMLVAQADLPDAVVAPDPLMVIVGGIEFIYIEAVEAVDPGSAAEDYGDRPWPVAYYDRWHLIDGGAFLSVARDSLDPAHIRAFTQIV